MVLVKPADMNYIVKSSSLFGIINSLLIFQLIRKYDYLKDNLKYNILFLTILSINIQFIIVYGLDRKIVIASLLGVLFGLVYIVSFGYIIPNIF